VTPYIGAAAQTVDDTQSTSTSALVGGLTNGTAYTFTVSDTFSFFTTTYLGAASSPSNQVTPMPQNNGSPPAVALSTKALDFGSLLIGSTSGSQTVTVSDAGSQTLHIATVTLGGANAADFVMVADGCSGKSVLGGASCSVSVAMKPTAEGARAASLSLTDDASDSPQAVALSGNGVRPGSLSGEVIDGSDPGDPPLGGSVVKICPQSVSVPGAACASSTTGCAPRCGACWPTSSRAGSRASGCWRTG